MLLRNRGDMYGDLSANLFFFFFFFFFFFGLVAVLGGGLGGRV